jgi:hypothetical protein
MSQPAMKQSAATASVTRLRIDDEAFLVASLIERCPKVMMLRELVQNALEAADLAPAGRQRVEILPTMVAGARKLAIRNTGPGMGAEELFRMCDLAASLGKEKGLDRNFGMGAKVASLPANRLGLRYRSCKGGRVHEVVIGKRDGVYGRVRRSDPLTGKSIDVADATGAAMADAMPLHHDWTEVVLLGDRADQDTVADPYDGAPAMSPDWIAEGLYHRFYRIPRGVSVLMQDGTHRLTDMQEFRPIVARGRAFARYEAVALEDGTVLHYLFDPEDPENGGRNRSERGALQAGASLTAIVYRDEMYDVRSGWMWSQAGPRFGISFGAQHFSVHVELPLDAPVLTDAYRQFLRWTTGEQKHVEVTDFAAAVAANRPAWLLDELRALGPDPRIAASLKQELHDLMRGLGVRRAPRGAALTPQPVRAVAAGRTEGMQAGTAPVGAPAGPAVERAAEPDDEHEIAPEIVLLRDQRHVHDRLLDGRAASYDAASHELYVNMRYPAFTSMREALVAEHAEQPDQTALAAAANAAVEEMVIRRIGRALVHGISKRDAATGWNTWQLQAAVSPEALTIAADDFHWAMPEARMHMARALAGEPA